MGRAARQFGGYSTARNNRWATFSERLAGAQAAMGLATPIPGAGERGTHGKTGQSMRAAFHAANGGVLACALAVSAP